MACEELVRMRAGVHQLHREAIRERNRIRLAEHDDRRSRNRGRSDALAHLQRRIHSAIAALEHHILSHGCQT